MEREAFFSGYCRNIDNSRIVAVEAENTTLTEADCDYGSCPYEPSCPIAQKIREFLFSSEVS